MLQNQALEIMKMGYNVFLTGEAGTGKTYVLNKYIKHLKKKNIRFSVTASTGIAATHLDGVTLDSWSGIGIRDDIAESDLKQMDNKFHLKNRIQKTKVLLIDEISMVSGVRFDAIDRILKYIRKSDLPFGGIQIILSGDLFQLPPFSNDKNNNDYIFKSKAWNMLDLHICYLHEPKRQKDMELLDILNKIRHNRVNAVTRNILLNTNKPELAQKFIPTKLYTHNIDVDVINKQELDKNNNESHFYNMTHLGPESLIGMMKRSCLAPENLELKKGADVMFVRNNYDKGYVNGTLGTVIGFNKNSDPIVKIMTGLKIEVEPAIWTITDENKIIAQITQIPLRLAWAITVHKSQGMTLDAAEIDLSKTFIEGMGYVALSRVKSLNNLRLLGINDLAFQVNSEVFEFDKLLVGQSEKMVDNLKKMNWFSRFIRKWKFMYKLTS